MIVAWLQAREAGQPPDRQRLLAEYPELAEDLAAFFEGKETDRALEEIRREGIPVPREVIAAGMDPDGRLSVSSIESILDWWQQVGALPNSSAGYQRARQRFGPSPHAPD